MFLGSKNRKIHNQRVKLLQLQEFDKVKAQYQTGIVCNKIIQVTKANELS